MKGRWKALFIGGDFFVIGIIFMLIFGQVTELSCDKPQLYVTECKLERKLLGVITVSSITFIDVSEAWVESNCDDSCTYRVMLQTSDGQQPLTGFYSSGEGTKLNTANEINAYIHSESERPLFVSEESGLFFALFSMVFVLIGLYIIIVKGIFQPMS